MGRSVCFHAPYKKRVLNFQNLFRHLDFLRAKLISGTKQHVWLYFPAAAAGQHL